MSASIFEALGYFLRRQDDSKIKSKCLNRWFPKQETSYGVESNDSVKKTRPQVTETKRLRVRGRFLCMLKSVRAIEFAAIRDNQLAEQ